MNPEIEQRMQAAKWQIDHDFTDLYPDCQVWEREGYQVVFYEGNSGHSVYLTPNIQEPYAKFVTTEYYSTPEEAFENFLQLPLLETTVSGLTGIR